MNEKIFNILKWAIILIIGGFVFYIVFPKYHFFNIALRGNKITGKIEILNDKAG